MELEAAEASAETTLAAWEDDASLPADVAHVTSWTIRNTATKSATIAMMRLRQTGVVRRGRRSVEVLGRLLAERDDCPPRPACLLCCAPRVLRRGGSLFVGFAIFVIEQRPFVFLVLGTGAAIDERLAGTQLQERRDDDAQHNRRADEHADARIRLEQEMVYRRKIHAEHGTTKRLAVSLKM